MSRTKFELEYNEYLARREAAGFKRPPSSERLPSSARARGKFVPKSAEPKKQPKNVDPALLKGDGSYELPNNSYKPSGYKDKPSELGEDPLTSVRTLRNNLRKRALNYENQDLPVKAHLCEVANRNLSKAEGELLHLQQQRSNAIITGDSKTAELMNRKMEDVKERAVRDALADLVMDNDEMHAFGVDSKWTPDKQEKKPPSPRWTRPKTPSDSRFIPAAPVSRYKERAKTPEERPPRAVTPQRRAKTPQRTATPIKRRSSVYVPVVKKNDRLFPDGMASKKGPNDYDDPYDLPDTSGICQYCDQGDTNLGTTRGMDDHYANYCLMMNRCRYCSKVVPVATLTEHYLKKCSFLKDSMTPCPKCGLAMDKIDKEENLEHPLCRGRRAPEGAQWCPLCSVAVDKNRTAWQNHLMLNCFNNPRKMGINEDPTPPPEPVDPPLGKGKKRDPSDGRMIDATKLVKALQDVQLQKKNAKKNKAAPVEAPPAEAAAPPAATAAK